MVQLHTRKDPRFPSLGIAVDVVVFTVSEGRLQVLLTQRPDEEPFSRAWSLPGGFVGPEESADQAAEKQLAAKAGVRGVFLEQLYTFSNPSRDPRSRVVAVAYYALVASDRLDGTRGSRSARWLDVGTDEVGAIAIGFPPGGESPRLAFDHDSILQTAIDRIRGKLEYVPIGFQLLPEQFTLTDLQQVYEAVLGRKIDKRNFRSKLLKSGMVRDVGDTRRGPHRPAKLYTFTARTF